MIKLSQKNNWDDFHNQWAKGTSIVTTKKPASGPFHGVTNEVLTSSIFPQNGT